VAREDTLTTRFEANIQQFENELRKLQRLNARSTSRVASEHERAARQSEAAWKRADLGGAMTRSMGNIGPMVARYATMIAGMFAGREAIQAADTYTRFTNSLRVAGLAGIQLEQVQGRLFEMAQKNGIALEPLGQLYGRLAQSQRELGANSQQLLRFTGGVASALRVAGTDATAAQGALLQLSQAMGAGIVRAEEYNSINEGARPILEAVARGTTAYGGSVAKLREDILKGNVTSREFFDGFLRGSAALEAQAAQAPLTVAQSMTVLQNALTQYIGQTDQGYSITERLGMAIRSLATNIDSVINAVTILGTLYAATFLPAIGRASAAIALQSTAFIQGAIAARGIAAGLSGVAASSGVASVAMMGLRGAMAFLGGPIGIAVIGITAAVAYLGVTSATAAMEAEELKRRIEAQNQALHANQRASVAARAETGELTQAEYNAAVAAANLTGEAGKLSNRLYLVAAAAKSARVEVARLGLERARSDRQAAEQAYQRRVDGSSAWRRAERPFAERGLARDALPVDREGASRAAHAEVARTPEATTLRQARENEAGAQRELERVRRDGLDSYRPAPVAAPRPAAAARPNRSGGRSNNNAAEEAERRREASEDLVIQAQRELAEATRAEARTSQDRHDAAVARLVEERDERLRDITRRREDNQITEESANLATALVNQTFEVKRASEVQRSATEVADRQREIAQLEGQHAAEQLRLDADVIEDQARAARTIRERHQLEREALERRQQSDDALFALEQDRLALERQRNSYTAEEIARLRQQAEDNRARTRANETNDLRRTQEGEGPKSWGDWASEQAEGFGDLNTQLQGIASDGLDSLTKGLTAALMGTKSLKEAFSDMAKSMISQLIEMAIRFAIFEAIGMALGVPGLGKAAVGIGRNAAGTDNWRGGLSLVGEAGPELVYMPKGAQVLPNNLLRNAVSTPRGAASGGVSVFINTHVNASDAVLSQTVKQWIFEANTQAVQQAQRMTMKTMQRGQQNSLLR
jgi:tape measure domain-containing protein